ncbi:glycosyltransferase family 9 protein [Paraburkholderia sp. A2WS-5]|uniref:glycosyltransferase family 9 protein n=1 Tax=unclassified Paraburkholderia TaxID=2615204 RepID=UPI003B7E21E3
MTAPFEAGFDDVAVLISSIDRVVTIDSGPAHLAGALGAPTSLLVDHVSTWFWGSETACTLGTTRSNCFGSPRWVSGARSRARVRARLEALMAS